jgi:hypothetical protein
MNEHVEAFLKKYLGIRPPPGAVLVNAPWGAGKTFLVKRVLRDLGGSYIYVSVNGATTYEELVRRTVLATYPVLSGKSLQALGSLAKSALGVFRIQTDLTIEKVFDLPSHHVIVFDDAERALIDIRQLMGFFNALCEGDENHVIILCNEDEIEKKRRYAVIKEKTVYFTIRITSDISSLLVVLKGRVTDKYAMFIESSEEDIVEAFSSIGSQNLRTFQNALSDFEPIFTEAQELQLADEIISEALKLFLILAVAVKDGTLARSDLKERTDAFTAAFQQHAGGPETPLSKLQKKHGGTDLYAATLDNELLEAVLYDGVATRELIQRSLAPLSLSAASKAVPPWRRVWYYMQNAEVKTETAISELRQQMAEFQITFTGEILHTFGVLFELAQAGVISEMGDDVLGLAKQYTDDLASRDSFQVDIEDDRYGLSSAYGLGFMQSSNPLFREASSYLLQKVHQSRVNGLKRRLKESLDDITTRSLEFRKLVLQSSSDENLAREPALHEIEASFFVKQVLRLTGDEQLEVFLSIGRRLEEANEKVFSAEIAWAREVIRLTRDAAVDQPALRRARIRKMSEWVSTALDQREESKP